jgi:hypothetical protein
MCRAYGAGGGNQQQGKPNTTLAKNMCARMGTQRKIKMRT